jgi:uncharacterized membrane protein YjjP (DUF1212 family)
MWSASPAAATTSQVMPGAPDPEIRCLLALGSALLGYGLPAHRVEESLLRLARALGVQISVFGLPTVVLITAHRRGCDTTHSARAALAAIDLSRLDALHRLISRVERSELDAVTAELEARAIIDGPGRHPSWLNFVAVASVTFGGALMLGAPTNEAAWSALLGLGVGALLGVSARNAVLERITPILATALVTLASVMLSHAGVVAHPLVVTFAAMLVLLPGLALTLAMVELATGHLVSGAARSIGAAALFLQLASGVLVGLELGQLDTATISPLAPATFGMASLGALLLALGFAVLLVIRLRDALPTLVICALAFFVCRGAGVWLGADLGVLIAATTVGLCSHTFACKCDRPSSTLTLPGVVMLVPGSLGLIAVSAAALHDPARALDVGFQMSMVVVALSTGILIAAAALPPRTSI